MKEIEERPITEETLDPQHWQEMRQLGHRMLDDMMDFLENIRDEPTWQPVPDSVQDSFKSGVPKRGVGIETAYRDFKETILPYPMGNVHPKFWGWALGTGTPFSMLAEMLAAGMNSNLGGGDHAANYVESQVLDWSKEMLGFPRSASGLLVSGASMANLIGLTVARNQKAGYDVRAEGVRNEQSRLFIYASAEGHSSVQKAVELLGLGRLSLRNVPVNNHFQMDISALRRMIREDRADGHHPICLIGSAGTINTGAFDDLAKQAEIARQEDLWFHVDGAFGALAALSPALSHLIAGMEEADSLAFDFHKWMYMPYEAGCILVKNAEEHHRSFSLNPEYLAHIEGGIASGGSWFHEYGLQLSRQFRALKIWMSLKEHGLEKFRRMVEQNCRQGQHLAGLINQEKSLALLAPVPLNIVCFRFLDDDLNTTELNALNQEILIELQESGTAVPSHTMINGKFAIRPAFFNHRTKMADIDDFVSAVLKIGRRKRKKAQAEDLRSSPEPTHSPRQN